MALLFYFAVTSSSHPAVLPSPSLNISTTGLVPELPQVGTGVGDFENVAFCLLFEIRCINPDLDKEKLLMNAVTYRSKRIYANLNTVFSCFYKK